MDVQDKELSYKLRLATRIIGFTGVIGLFQYAGAALIGLPTSIFMKTMPIAFLAHAAPILTILVGGTSAARVKIERLLFQATIAVLFLWIVTGVMKQLQHVDEALEIQARLWTNVFAFVWFGIITAVGVRCATTIEGPLGMRALTPWPWLKLTYSVISALVTVVAFAGLAVVTFEALKPKASLRTEEEISEQAYLRLPPQISAFIEKECREPTVEERVQLRANLEAELRRELGLSVPPTPPNPTPTSKGDADDAR